MTMKPPPPTPEEKGSTTPSTPAAAIDASTALPPLRRTRIAAWVASGSTVAAAPRVPTAVRVLGGAGTAAPAGNAATSVMRTTRTARPAMRDMNGSSQGCGSPTPGAGPSVRAGRVPDVQVVVVVDQRRDDPARAVEVEVRPDEDTDGARLDEAVDELLGEPAVDLGGADRSSLEAVAARVVDVDVEAALVGRVPQAAVPRAEEAAVRAREVADQHPRPVGVLVAVLAQHELDAVDGLGGAPAPPPAVRRAPEDRIPGHEVERVGRELHAVAQMTRAGCRRRRGQRGQQRPQQHSETYLPCHSGGRFSANALTPS